MGFNLLKNGEVYAPEPLGQQDVLLDGVKILRIGQIDAHKLADAGFGVNVYDVSGCYVTPGIIDPHSHIIGAGGEQGFDSRMPELFLGQVIGAGITTVIGLLGTDTATRYLSTLQAKVNQFWAEGISAYMYTAGFEIPPSTITGSVRDDLVMIDKVIGAGEVAISDYRWLDPELHPLAQLITEAMQGGMIAGKAGVTHFHVGEGKKRLALLREVLDSTLIPPEYIYITHITRSQALMDEAIDLARRGCKVDMDTVEGKIEEHLRYYLEHGGPLDRLTLSSDSNTPGGTPQKLYEQVVSCLRASEFSFEQVLSLVTANTAEILKLKNKGRLKAELDADVLVLHQDTLEIMHLFARGEPLVKDGQAQRKSQGEEHQDKNTTVVKKES